MPLDYETLYREAYRENVADAPRAAVAGELDEKIANFCDLHGFARGDVVAAIQENRIAAACFAINPNKQNFHEKIAAGYIRKIDGVVGFVSLSKKAKVVSNGSVMTGKELKLAGGVSSAKTIDFEWRCKGRRFYASHKYTKQSGGSQGNQYKDLQAFIKEANSSALKKTFFVAIADGGFYQEMDSGAGTSRIDRLKSIATPKALVCEITELEAMMKRVVE